MTNVNELLRFTVTGDTGGTGATTTAGELAKTIGLEKISGGSFFRGLAYHYQEFTQSYQSLETSTPTPQEIWLAFTTLYKTLLQSGGMTAVLDLLKTYTAQPSNNEILKKFQHDLATLSLNDENQVDPIWDMMTDDFLVKTAVAKSGFVWESKLAILARYIDTFQPLFANQEATFGSHLLPITAIRLYTEEAEANRRVSERDGSQEVNVLARQRRDFQRYGSIYTIKGKPVVIADLAKYASGSIDTTQKSPDQVIEASLNIALNVISSTQATPELAQEAIAYINKILK